MQWLVLTELIVPTDEFAETSALAQNASFQKATAYDRRPSPQGLALQ